MISTKTSKAKPVACTTVHQSGALPTRYRGDLAAGTIEKVIGGNAWLPVRWRDDLIPYEAEDVRRVALAVLCDFTGDDRAALLLHNVFVHYWNLDQLEGTTWACRTGYIAKWVDKKLRKLVPTPQYTMSRPIAEAIARLAEEDPERWEPLPAIHHPDLQQRRRKETV